MVVSINGGTPKSSIKRGFYIISHPAIGVPQWLWTPLMVSKDDLHCLSRSNLVSVLALLHKSRPLWNSPSHTISLYSA